MSPLLLCLFTPPSSSPSALAGVLPGRGCGLQAAVCHSHSAETDCDCGRWAGAWSVTRPRRTQALLSHSQPFFSPFGFQIVSFALLILISSSVVPICLLSLPSLSFPALFPKGCFPVSKLLERVLKKLTFVILSKPRLKPPYSHTSLTSELGGAESSQTDHPLNCQGGAGSEPFFT